MGMRNMVVPIVVLFGGVLFLVFGLILASTILDTATDAGADATIGSFSGAQPLNDLVPFIYYTIVIVGGLGLIVSGGFIAAKTARGD